MGVVGDGLGKRSVDAEALGEARGEGARVMVTLEDEGLQDVLVGQALQAAVDDGHAVVLLDRHGEAGQRLHDAHLGVSVGQLVPRRVEGGNPEGVGADRGRHVHRVEHEVRPGIRRGREERAAVLCHDLSVDDDALDAEVAKVVDEDQVSTLARRDGAHVARHLEALRHVDGDHLDGGDRVDAVLDGLAQDAVEVPLGDERLGVVVVGDEADETRVDGVADDGLRELAKVVPGRSLAHERVLSHADLGRDVLGARRLVAARDAGGDVGVEQAVGVGHGEVARHDLASLEGLVDLLDGVVLAAQDARVVHHLAETHHGVPGHGLADVLGVDC